MGELISKQMAIEALKKIDQELWGIDIERSTVPEYIEHHEQIKAVRTIVQDLIDKIKDEPSAQKWIPCSERLPEKDGRYWISTKTIACEDNFENGEFVFYRSNVIAWMPLPEPWRGEA